MNGSSGRTTVIFIIFLSVGIIFLLRLFYMQVLDNSYFTSANNNVLRPVIEYPARGLIYDRKGRLLRVYVSVYDLMIIPKQAKGIDTAEFCKLTGITTDDYDNLYLKARSYSSVKPSIFIKQLSVETYARMQEVMFKFPGFFVQPRTLRKYPDPMAAHLFGYIGEVDTNITKKDSYYKEGDYIGKSGIEQSYEKELRGKRGVKYVLVDVFNRPKGSYHDGQFDTIAEAGKNFTLSLDAKLQKYGEELFQNKVGGVVAIDPSTGEILACVSSPGYDPNLLVGRERTKNYADLLFAPTKPLFNRALMGEYPPGSTFKLINDLIGEQEGVLFPNTTYYCDGGYHMGNLTVKCDERHGSLNLESAIAHSCNTYHCYVYRSIIDQKKFNTTEEGYENWRNHVLTFGIGKRLFSDLPQELKGNLPSVEFFDKYYGKGHWKFSNLVSMSIGQGELELTPLQMANTMCIIANKGYYYIPHIAKQIGDSAFNVKHFTEKQYTDIDPKYFDIVQDGMESVVESGTAAASKIKGITVCGKTGTAQNPHGKNHSLFVGFAPRENPKIAIGIMVENGGWGAAWAAPIASLMIEKYLTDTITRPELEKRMKEGVIIPKSYMEEMEKREAKKDTSSAVKVVALKNEPLRNQKGILQNIDWLMVSIYLLLVTIGWFNIYAAVYNEGHKNIFDLTQNYGKQAMWIGGTIFLALSILIIDGKFYAAFAYPIYLIFLVALLYVIAVARDIKGAVAWIDIGSFKLQPSEFAKFATNMALAKYLSTLNTRMKDFKTKFISILIISLPALFILLQNDTGSAMVYAAFVFVLYREGLSGNILILICLAAVLFVLTLLIKKLILISIIVGISLVLLFFIRKKRQNIIILVSGALIACAIVFSVDYAFNHVLQEHQRTRINVLLGKDIDPKGAGYNVNQSKIAIGSGGFLGKGFLQGTQTKYDFVPEQSTDFIFCTVGEEWGFVGCFVVIGLFMLLLWRILMVAERQRSQFSRIYGYGVASILFFHIMINIGMAIGLAPVIGIPLPFFSYGGSSLWSFTILLFIFIKLDAYRLQILR